jgi:hypothetical protein
MARMVSDTGDLMRLLRATVIRARVDGRIRGRIYLCSPILIPEATTRLQRRGSPYIRAKSAGTLFLKTWAKLPGHIGNLLNTMAVLFPAETLFRSVLKSHLASKSA